MILADDNFVTIIDAVKTGRHIYDNIKKAIHFLISTNVGEIVAIFLGLLLGLDTPLLTPFFGSWFGIQDITRIEILLPIHILWINLITDSFPAIALGLEPADKKIMNKKPNNSKEGLFADGLWGKIFIEGTMIGVLTLFTFSLGNRLYGLKVARTMAFASLSFLELIHSFNIRTDESIFKVGIFKNLYLTGAVILGIIMQLIVIVIPQIANIFDVVLLNKEQWMYTIIISILPIFIMEGQKMINKAKAENNINNKWVKNKV